MQRRDDFHARGHQLKRCLRGRALPHAKHARCAPADGGSERDSGVDQQLALAQRPLDVFERLGLAAEGNAQDDRLDGLDGLRVLGAGEAALRHSLARTVGCLDRAALLA